MAKIKIYLETRRISVKSGEAPLNFAVSHRTKTAYIPLNITLAPKYWDAQKRIVVGHPRKKHLNDLVRSMTLEIMVALQEVEKKFDINSMDVKELRDRIVEYKNPNRIKLDDEKSLSNLFGNFVSTKSGRTKELYETTWRKIKAFEGKRAETLRCEEINVDWLNRFNVFLSASAPSANARAIHMRNLRAVFNYAIDNEITDNYPFRRFKIKQEATRKRNFDAETLRAIFNADNLEPWMEKYRDLFKLSFMLIGINFVDLCNLQEVRNGRINYIRAKTKKLYSIKLEPEIEELIARYKGEKCLLNYLDSYKSYRHFYNNTCKGLRAIKERVNEQPGVEIDTLTTYWARHSWATIAAYLDIPKETIAAALGHSDRSVTDIYIEFDKRKVDVANRRVLNFVLYGYDGGYAPDDLPSLSK